MFYATGIATGADGNGLIASLIGAGLARTDQHGMGIEITETLQIMDGAGRSGAAWALGPIARGVFWECTAVPDIRIEARTVADEVARYLQAKPGST